MNEPKNGTAEKNLVGTQLGEFDLLRRLGRGGMAEVYLAKQQSLQRKVAVKVLRSDLAQDENYVRRFQNEARAVASLIHANIVQIYEVNCIDGIHFLVQEYVPGYTLKQLVSKKGPVSVARGISILSQVAAALNRAGNQMMVHRDIKPENILLTPNGEAKVADFGLARVAQGDGLDLTQDGVTMGTPLYMSPEQVEGKTLDPRSDLYSLGVTAFYMLAGHPPFEGETPLNVAVQHLQKEAPRLHDERPELPEKLGQIVARLLEKDPDDRFQTAADVLKDIRQISKDGDFGDIEVDDTLVDFDETNEELLDATLQLQAVMETQTLLIQRKSRFWPWTVITFLALGIGVGMAHFSWNGPLLDAGGLGIRVEKQDSAKLQFFRASFASPEDAEAEWLAVWKYHASGNPTNDYWIRLAKRRLAAFYLDQGRFDESLAIYEELGSYRDTDEDSWANGVAGQVVVYLRKNDKDKAKLKLVEVWDSRQRVDPEILSQLESWAAELGISDQLNNTE